MTRTIRKRTLVTICAIMFLVLAYLGPAAYSAGGGPDGVVTGVINDNMPTDSDGVGDNSEYDPVSSFNAFILLQDAEGADSNVAGSTGDDKWSGVGAKPRLIRVRTQYQVWTRDVTLTEPGAVGIDAHIQATITTEYFFWHGDATGAFRGNHVAPFGVDICYAFKGAQAPGVLWSGISANISWEDNARFIGVEDIRTGDKGRGGCKHYKIPVSQREWLVFTQHPRWIGDGWINWKLDGDQSFHWHTHRDDDSKWLSPSSDPVMSTKSGQIWHNIFKTW